MGVQSAKFIGSFGRLIATTGTLPDRQCCLSSGGVGLAFRVDKPQLAPTPMRRLRKATLAPTPEGVTAASGPDVAALATDAASERRDDAGPV